MEASLAHDSCPRGAPARLLAACLVATSREPSAAFFLTPFRAWEFLAGSVLASIHERHGVPVARSWRTEAASWSGLALLGFGLAWIAEGDPFPSWRAAIPVAGTALVIAAGTGALANRWILSLKPIVWVGLISYPLYLFHWPLLSFLHVLKGPEPDADLVWGAVGLSVALAAAAYYGLERPIRPSRWKGTVPALVGAFVLLGGLGLGIASGTVPARPVSADAQRISEAIAATPLQWRHYSEGYRLRSTPGVTIARVGATERQTLFFGDSTMMMLGPRVRKLVEDGETGTRGAVIVAGGGLCPIPGATNPIKPNQANLIQALEEEIAANPAIDRVVIGGLWNHFFAPWSPWENASGPMGKDDGRARGLAEFGALIARLEASGKRVYVVLPPPGHENLDPGKMFARDLLGGSAMRAIPYTIEAFAKRSRVSRPEEVFALAAANGAELIDPVPSLSRDGIFIAIDESGPVRSDHMHLLPEFSRKSATYADHTLKELPHGIAPTPPSTPAPTPISAPQPNAGT